MTSAAIYVRISSDRSGQRAGVERQRVDCEALAAANGLTVVEVYEENDLSAYSGKPRPEFERLIADAAEGRFQTVIVWASDRLYRRMADLVRITDELAPHVQIKVVVEGDVDLESAEGIMRAQIMGSVAEFESRRKSERIKARARQRAFQERRTVASSLPFGWCWADPDPNDPTRPREGTKRGMEPDPITGPALVQAYRDVADGLSLYEAHRRLSERVDVGRMASSTLGLILRNPRNCGLATYRGEIVGEASDGLALVERDLWENVERILSDPSRRTSPGRPADTLLGGGLLRCGKCDGPMAASRKRGEPVYVCSRNQCMTRRRALVDPLVTERVADILDGLAAADMLVSPDDEQDPTAEVRAGIADLEAKVSGLDAALASGDLDVIDYTRAVGVLRARIDEQTARLVKVARRPALANLCSSDDAGDAWQGQPLDARRAALRELLDRITCTTDRGLEYQWAGWMNTERVGVPLTSREVLPSASRNPQRDALSEALGRPVDERIRELRADGLSWRRVASVIGEEAGRPVCHTTVAKYAEGASA